MKNISMLAMIKSGVYFGHRKRFGCPAFGPYLYGVREGIHIINLEKTLPMLDSALNFISQTVYNQGEVLIVGTKRAAQDLVRENAVACGMPYVDKRWLGGMLTNFKTIKKSVKRLTDLSDQIKQGLPETLTKKEKLSLFREKDKLSDSLGGIEHMNSLPDAVFVIDIGAENIAVAEAKRLGIPVIGIVDTNCSPLGIDYPIPGNDDSRRAINFYLTAIAEVVSESKAKLAEEMAATAAVKEKELKTVKAYSGGTAKSVPVAEKKEDLAKIVSLASEKNSASAATKKVPKVIKKTSSKLATAKAAATDKATPVKKTSTKGDSVKKASVAKKPVAKATDAKDKK